MYILLGMSIALLAGLMLSRVAKILNLPAVTAYLVAGILIGPFVLGVIWKRVTKCAAWVSVCSSLALTVGLVIFFGYHRCGFDCSFGKAIATGVGCSPMIGVICMIFSVVSTVVVSLLTKAPSDEIIYEAFDKPLENEIK